MPWHWPRTKPAGCTTVATGAPTPLHRESLHGQDRRAERPEPTRGESRRLRGNPGVSRTASAARPEAQAYIGKSCNGIWSGKPGFMPGFDHAEGLFCRSSRCSGMVFVREKQGTRFAFLAKTGEQSCRFADVVVLPSAASGECLPAMLLWRPAGHQFGDRHAQGGREKQAGCPTGKSTAPTESCCANLWASWASKIQFVASNRNPANSQAILPQYWFEFALTWTPLASAIQTMGTSEHAIRQQTPSPNSPYAGSSSVFHHPRVHRRECLSGAQRSG